MSWIGVDFDGTLAEWTPGGGMPLGEPVQPMLERVKGWLSQGKEVRIFTARASTPELIPEVEAWCVKHIGQKLAVTCMKDFGCIEIWDDIAVRIERNTGRIY